MARGSLAATRLVLPIITSALLLLVLGCNPTTPGGGNDGIDDSTFGSTPTDGAYTAPAPTGGLSPASAGTNGRLGDMLGLLEGASGSVPATDLEAIARQFADMLESNPNDAGAQLGMALSSMAVAGNDIGDALGYDLDAGEWVQAAARGDIALAASLAVAPIRSAIALVSTGVPSAAGSAIVRANPLPGTPVTLSDVWDAIDVALGWLGSESDATSVIGRLAALAAMDTTIATVVLDEEEINIEPWMVQAGLAIALDVKALMLVATAYDPETGDFEIPNGSTGFDENGDSKLTPDEYLPPDPFGTLMADGADRLTAASEAMGRATYWLGQAIDGAQADEQLNWGWTPPEPDGQGGGGSSALAEAIDIPEPEPDWSGIRTLLDAIDAIRTGPVALELYGFDYSGASPQFVTDTVRVDLSPLFSGTIADIKALLPTLVPGEYGGFEPEDLGGLTLGGILPDGADINRRVNWQGISHVGTAPVPMLPPIIANVTLDGQPWWEYAPIAPGATVEIAVEAYDPVGGTLTYAYEVSETYGSAFAGAITGSGSQVTYDSAGAEATGVSVVISVTNESGLLAQTWLTMELSGDGGDFGPPV